MGKSNPNRDFGTWTYRHQFLSSCSHTLCPVTAIFTRDMGVGFGGVVCCGQWIVGRVATCRFA